MLRRAWHELKTLNVSDVTSVRLELVERLTESFSTVCQDLTLHRQPVQAADHIGVDGIYIKELVLGYEFSFFNQAPELYVAWTRDGQQP